MTENCLAPLRPLRNFDRHFSKSFSPPQICKLSGPVLRDTARLSQRYPPIVCYGVFDVSTWPIGCDTPSPFSERFPLLRACEVEVRYPPLKRGISAILARYPMKTRQMGVIPPSAIRSRKGIARYGGGLSRTGLLSFQKKQNILGDKIQGPSFGTTKETKAPFRTHVLSGLRWLQVA